MNATRIAESVVKSICVGTLAFASFSHAAAPPPPAAPVAPRAYNAIDLTGTWVAVVTEDWRWRMVTPPKGDYTSVPISPEGRKIADAWDPSQDGSCLAYGGAALLRMPTRVRISWESDSVLKVESDAGQQTRRLAFGAVDASTPPSLQGNSQARWIPDNPRIDPTVGLAPLPPPPQGNVGRHSTLEVQTTKLTGGWLRLNGVPYSAETTMTEYFDRFTHEGEEWMVVTSIVTDPKYLRDVFATSSHFKKEPNDSKWHPTSCRN